MLHRARGEGILEEAQLAVGLQGIEIVGSIGKLRFCKQYYVKALGLGLFGLRC